MSSDGALHGAGPIPALLTVIALLVLPYLVVIPVVVRQYSRIQNRHFMQQQSSVFMIRWNLGDFVQNILPPHNLPETRIRFLVQIMVILPSRSMIYGIIDFVNVKSGPPGLPANPTVYLSCG